MCSLIFSIKLTTSSRIDLLHKDCLGRLRSGEKEKLFITNNNKKKGNANPLVLISYKFPPEPVPTVDTQSIDYGVAI